MDSSYQYFDNWEKEIDVFIDKCHSHQVKMLMVGGGAVNFYGYQRHSADIDFWIDSSTNNLELLREVLLEMGFEFSEFPKEVEQKTQNISLKFSPTLPTIELITNFSSSIDFETAFQKSEWVTVNNKEFPRWRVIAFDDLLESKIRSGRPKDLLDVMELKKIRNNL